MVYNDVLDAFENGSLIHHPDAEAPWSVVVNLMKGAMPFDMTDEVIEIATDIASPDMSDDHLVDLFRSVELPAPITWLELNDRRHDRSTVRYGLLLLKTDDDTVLHVKHFPMVLGHLREPDFSTRVNLQTGSIALDHVDHVWNLAKRVLMGAGASESEVEGRMEQAVDGMAEVVLRATKIAYHGLQLLNAKNAPVQAEVAELFSRQQRRAMERRAPGSSKVSRITRIVLNAQGRAQLSAIRSEDGYEARRRAHWVRGHLMRTQTKGLIWRKCHVRGMGDPVMRTRVVSASSGPSVNPVSN